MGSFVVEQLLAAGHTVRVLEPRMRGGNGRPLAAFDHVEWMVGDLDVAGVAEGAGRGCELAFYLASSTNPAETWNDPIREVDEGIRRTVLFLQGITNVGVRKVVMPSSGGTIYGRAAGRLNEQHVAKPFSPHGIAKYSAELFGQYFQEKFGLAMDVYRISNAYGPRQRMDRKQGVVAVWMGQILRGETVRVFGDDSVRRDYVYVEDVARLMMHSLRDLDACGVWNIGSGIGTSILDLLRTFQKIIPHPFPHVIESLRAFDNTSAILDNSKLRALYPGLQLVSLHEGLSRTWAWYAQSPTERQEAAPL